MLSVKIWNKKTNASSAFDRNGLKLLSQNAPNLNGNL